MKQNIEEQCRKVLKGLRKMWWDTATKEQREEKVRKDSRSQPLFGDDDA